MAALIFGASGQDGHYLAEACRERGIAPVGVSRSGQGAGSVQGDVSRFEQVEELVRAHRPEFIFQMAAASTTRHEALLENHATIAGGAINVMEAARRYAPKARVFLAGSGLQFENLGAPISERAAFAATSAYSLARIHATYAARYYRSLGLLAYVGYLFHHESPLRKPGHVSMIVANAARRAADGTGEMLELGDISVEKEWTFAGDVARAVLTLVDQERVFEAAIGSGETHSIRSWVEACYRLVGLDWRQHVKLKDGFVPEYLRLTSDPATIRSLGWAPQVDFAQLARMMVLGP